jgi:GH24 family phage-related lysozyme (muramidase)
VIDKASRLGVLFKCRREGRSRGAYLDDSTGRGRHSAGYGHQGADVEPGGIYSDEQIDAWLKADVETREADLNAHLAKRKIEPTQQQYDALLSRYYQGGTDDLTAILDCWPDLMKKGQRHRFNRWWLAHCRNAKGEKLDGLQDRGLMELMVFWRGEYGDVWNVPYWNGNPTGKKPDGIYMVKPTDVSWRQ